MADDVSRDVPLRYPAPTGARLSDRFNLEKVSWGSIWAGTMITIGMEALFLSFGIFIGAAFGGSVVWSMAWYLVTMGVSFYVGAASSARLADVANRDIRIQHGLTTWGLATLATAIIGGVLALAVYGKMTTPLDTTVYWGSIEQWGGLIWAALC
jgi:hypothetical protein